MHDISAIRKEYAQKTLEEGDVNSDPLEQFQKWFDEAIEAEVIEPNAMTLSTVSAEGQPTGRVVLLKGIKADGFQFYTNYGSQKGREISDNPKAGLTFFWAELERQVRIDGELEKLSDEENDKYFHSRPRGSRLGALVSPQSEPIEDRKWLEKRLEEVETEHRGKEPARPETWGGYVLKPCRIEFWQGRPSRLHDRIEYRLSNNKWHIRRLAP